MKTWKSAGVSVRGFAHVESGVPCQDAHAVRIFENGFVAAVADGAGSARHSHLGAALFADSLVYRSLLPALIGQMDLIKLETEIKKCVNRCRDELSTSLELESQESVLLSDYAATLLVAVSNGHEGFFFHVGDGAAVAFSEGSPENSVISRPANGQYANETYFVTMEEWEQYLRTTSFSGGYDTVLLMSDGVTPMAMTKGCDSLFGSFVEPVTRYLGGTARTAGENGLVQTLSSEQVRKVTGDDKTLVWCQWAGDV